LRLLLREPDARQLRRGVDDRRHHSVVSARSAGSMLGRYQALLHRLVRQQRRPGDIADSVDVRQARLHVVVDDLDVAALVDLDADLLETQVAAVGAPADGHQDAVDLDYALLASGSLELHGRALLALLL